MITKLLTLTATAMTMMALGSCDGSKGGGNAACGDFTACGGDVTGTWTIDGFCGKGTAKTTMCADPLTIDLAAVVATGEQSFNADKTYSSNAQVSGSATLHIPASCLMVSGLKLSCDYVPQVFMTLNMMMPNNPIDSLSCIAEGEGCSCKAVLKASALTESGTYVTSGNSLTLTPTGGAPAASDYCVAGTSLKHKPAAGTTATSFAPGALATVVLTKK